MPVMVLVFVGGIAIMAIVAVGGAITAIRARRWLSAAFWMAASLFLLAWLYGIAGQYLVGTHPLDHACLSPWQGGKPGEGVPTAPLPG